MLSLSVLSPIQTQAGPTSIFHAMSLLREPTTTLPKPNALYWLGGYLADYVRLFLGESLRTLATCPCGDDEMDTDMESSLTYLPRLSSGINQIALSFSPSPGFAQVLVKLTQLHCIYIRTPQSLMKKVVHAIASLPTLQELILVFSLESASHETNGPFFPRLNQLHIYGDYASGHNTSLASCTGFLQRFHPSRLEKLEIRQCLGDAHPLTQLLETIPGIIYPETLKHLYMIILLGTATQPVDSKALLPLLVTRNLESLDLEASFREPQILATAWPQLSHFRLLTDHTGNTATTIEALAILVRHCPKLSYIELNFNASLLG